MKQSLAAWITIGTLAAACGGESDGDGAGLFGGGGAGSAGGLSSGGAGAATQATGGTTASGAAGSGAIGAAASTATGGSGGAPAQTGGMGGSTVSTGGMAGDGGTGAAGASPVGGAGGAPPLDCVCDGTVVVPAGCDPVCNTAFEVLFDASQLATIYLTIPDDNGGTGPSTWDTIASCVKDDAQSTTPPPECDYQPGTFSIEYAATPGDPTSEVITTPTIPVGIRRKGRVSWQELTNKPSLKVKFTNFSADRFMGLTRLTLNNMFQDHSMLHERTAYRIYRHVGLPAPLANNVRVMVRRNGSEPFSYWGLYANIQTLDKRFVHYTVPPGALPVGNLYDTYNDHYYSDLDRSSARGQEGTAPGAQESRFELETNEAVADTSDLTALLDAIYVEDPAADNSTFMEDVAQIANVDQFLRLFATQALITDWDGFAGIRNNYKLYHDPVSDRFFMFPWGTDQSFAWWDGVYYVNWDYSVDHSNSVGTESLFMRRCVNDPDDCYARYLTLAQEVTDAYGTLDMVGEVTAWAAQIDTAMADDPLKFYSTDASRRSVDYLKHYLAERQSCMNGQLSGSACAWMSCPLGFGSDCNAFGP